jgi:hypothetical protein
VTAELPDLDGLDPQERRRASNRAYNTAYQRQRTAASSRTHRLLLHAYLHSIWQNPIMTPHRYQISQSEQMSSE